MVHRVKESDRPPIESLACVILECPTCDQAGQGNLVIRKTYGRDHIRYLRCRSCQREFSERKNTPLWNSKLPESKVVAVAEQAR